MAYMQGAYHQMPEILRPICRGGGDFPDGRSSGGGGQYSAGPQFLVRYQSAHSNVCLSEGVLVSIINLHICVVSLFNLT